MRRFLILATAAVLAAGVIGTVSAHNDNQSGHRDAKASLNGFAEVPANSTTGSGTLRLTLDSANTTITFELSYKDLQGGPVGAAHLHLGQKGAAGGVMAFLCGGDGKPACPPSPATSITGTIVASNILGPSGQGIAPGEFAEFLRAIKAGMVYANVHTSAFPNGEIRGQVGGGWH